MKSQKLLWLVLAIALATAGCGSLQVEVGFKQPAELAATAVAQSTSAKPPPEPTAAPSSTEATFATYQPPAADGSLITDVRNPVGSPRG